jgi:hypothetical protein
VRGVSTHFGRTIAAGAICVTDGDELWHSWFVSDSHYICECFQTADAVATTADRSDATHSGRSQFGQ